MRISILPKLDQVFKRDTRCWSQAHTPISVKQPLRQQKLLETHHMHSPVGHFYQVRGCILCNATSAAVLPHVFIFILTKNSPLHPVPLGDVSWCDRLVSILQTHIINGSIQLNRYRTNRTIPDIAWFVFCMEKQVKGLRGAETSWYNLVLFVVLRKKNQFTLLHSELTG